MLLSPINAPAQELCWIKIIVLRPLKEKEPR